MNIKSAHFIPGTNKRLGDKYLLLECLGDGSHGWVWRAERLNDNQIVALKIPKDLTKEDKHLAEGRELLNVEPHPNVIKIHEMGRIDNEWFYIEMEYFPSQTLAQKLEQRAKNFGNTFERLFKIYSQVLEAIAYLADLPEPVSHGDIKPHNILVGANDLVKLTDFGSSALPEEIYVRTRENGGTVLYSAPEFSNVDSRRGSLDELMRGDIYSLGVLLYQLLTGQLPHDTPAQVQRHAPFRKPTEVNSSIHPEMESVILRCMQKVPEDRFNNISELKIAFKLACEKQKSVPAYTLQLSPSSPQVDWSTYVFNALEEKQYSKAARVAAEEYSNSGDQTALLQQLNALYRGGRYFDFESVFSREQKNIELPGSTAKAIRYLAIKVFLALRKVNEAKDLIEQSLAMDGESITLNYYLATLKGLEADYNSARMLLEEINRISPSRLSILTRLVQACEQMRDYSAAAGYLHRALRIAPDSEELLKKRSLYEGIGLW